MNKIALIRHKYAEESIGSSYIPAGIGLAGAGLGFLAGTHLVRPYLEKRIRRIVEGLSDKERVLRKQHKDSIWELYDEANTIYDKNFHAAADASDLKGMDAAREENHKAIDAISEKEFSGDQKIRDDIFKKKMLHYNLHGVSNLAAPYVSAAALGIPSYTIANNQ